MSTERQPTPFDDPYPGASKVSKNELSKALESVFYSFEHQEQGKSAMSEQLHLNEALMLFRAKEIGGRSIFTPKNLCRHQQILLMATEKLK